MKNIENEVARIVKDYYKYLDKGADMEVFLPFFCWEDFKIDNEGLIIDSLEKYKAWYSDVLVSMFHRKHDVRDLQVKEDKDEVMASIAMIFTAEDKASNPIRVEGNIEWALKRDPESGSLRISRYLISV